MIEMQKEEKMELMEEIINTIDNFMYKKHKKIFENTNVGEKIEEIHKVKKTDDYDILASKFADILGDWRLVGEMDIKSGLSKDVLEEKAFEALKGGNPYKKLCIHFYEDMQDRYLFLDGSVKTEEELEREYLNTAKKDIKTGYKERMSGYYDKWYRYERADEGRAYDIGCQLAMENPKCSGELYIIEVNH